MLIQLFVHSICNVLVLWPLILHRRAQNSLSHSKTLEMERKREAGAHKKLYLLVSCSVPQSRPEALWQYGLKPARPYVHGIPPDGEYWEWGCPSSSRDLHEPGMELASASPILSGRFMMTVTNTYSKFIKSSVSQVQWMCSSLGTIVWALDVRGDPRSQHTFSGSFLILLDGHLISLLYLVSDLESWSLILPR